jgi:hypothetical protein
VVGKAEVQRTRVLRLVQSEVNDLRGAMALKIQCQYRVGETFSVAGQITCVPHLAAQRNAIGIHFYVRRAIGMEVRLCSYRKALSVEKKMKLLDSMTRCPILEMPGTKSRGIQNSRTNIC